jgi:hypothetical protein
MDAYCTIRFRLNNICSPDDFGPGEPHETLDDLVRNLIEEEGGIIGLTDDQGEVVAIKEAR